MQLTDVHQPLPRVPLAVFQQALQLQPGHLLLMIALLVWENKATANGGFNDPALIAIAQGYGMTVEQCLENAQRFGANNEIWSGDASTGTKEGCWLRPYRKSTKNIWLRATVYLIDGSAGWHSVMTATNDNGMVVQTSQADLHLLHVPRQTRYNQNEVAMNDISLAENDQTSVSFGTDGVGMPMEYRSTSVCTASHQGTEMDAVDKSMDDHDKVCDPTTVASSGTLHGSCTVSNAHKVLCLL